MDPPASDDEVVVEDLHILVHQEDEDDSDNESVVSFTLEDLIIESEEQQHQQKQKQQRRGSRHERQRGQGRGRQKGKRMYIKDRSYSSLPAPSANDDSNSKVAALDDDERAWHSWDFSSFIEQRKQERSLHGSVKSFNSSIASSTTRSSTTRVVSKSSIYDSDARRSSQKQRRKKQQVNPKPFPPPELLFGDDKFAWSLPFLDDWLSHEDEDINSDNDDDEIRSLGTQASRPDIQLVLSAWKKVQRKDDKLSRKKKDERQRYKSSLHGCDNLDESSSSSTTTTAATVTSCTYGDSLASFSTINNSSTRSNNDSVASDRYFKEAFVRNLVIRSPRINRKKLTTRTAKQHV